ncbi:MAG TPA: hypothetical protein VNS09_05510 [Solirubrobacter sp.]|nr:hypothetical protein [Solirubrobacter sp.]
MTGRADGREWPSLRWVAVGLAVALAAGLAGWAIADRIAADPAGAPQAQRVVSAGEARLKVSGGWERAARPPALPGLGSAPAFTPYAGLATTVSVALLPADRADLVPAALAARARGGLPAAETARVVGLRARAYRGVHTDSSILDIYAIPTTRGVLTLVCAARDGAAEAPAWCLNGLDQVTVEGASPVSLDASTAYRMRSPEAFAALDKVRVRSRVALRRARGPVGQERAARELSRAYADAASTLTPVAADGSSAAKVVDALRGASSAYAGLARAADRRSKHAWARARTTVARAERDVKTRVAAVA